MAYTVLPIAGVLLNTTTPIEFTNDNGGTVPAFGPLGAETFGSDGLRYVFAKAAATIAPSTTACSIDTTAFTVTASGGSYISPAVSLVSGDYGWFGKASV
jgi:hypothetical protein